MTRSGRRTRSSLEIYLTQTNVRPLSEPSDLCNLTTYHVHTHPSHGLPRHSTVTDCHDVREMRSVEKALKAGQFSSVVQKLKKSHDLRSIAISLGNEKIIGLALSKSIESKIMLLILISCFTSPPKPPSFYSSWYAVYHK